MGNRTNVYASFLSEQLTLCDRSMLFMMLILCFSGICETVVSKMRRE